MDFKKFCTDWFIKLNNFIIYNANHFDNSSMVKIELAQTVNFNQSEACFYLLVANEVGGKWHAARL